jgi:hypothetical protein
MRLAGVFASLFSALAFVGRIDRNEFIMQLLCRFERASAHPAQRQY